MNLCIDTGNTRSKVAVYDHREMVYYDVIDRDVEAEIAAIYEGRAIDKVILSSTRSDMTIFEDLISEHQEILKLDHHTRLPFKNTYHTPETLGRDRIAVMAAATRLFPDSNSLVIDLGTCVTYDFIDKDGIYHGGNIAPGLHMRLQAMHEYTGKLPIVDPVYNQSLLGKSTEQALQNGAIYGIHYEIESIIDTIRDKFGFINVILTGGDAQFFVNVINSLIFVRPYLVLDGLNEILLYNEA